MKTPLRYFGARLIGYRLLLLVSALCVWSSLWLHAQTWGPFTYQRNGETIKITGYTGTERSLAIPETIEGRPVTALAAYALSGWDVPSITNLTLPATLISLGDPPLESMESLQHITVAEGNPQFSSRHGVLFNRDQTQLMRVPMAWTGDTYVIPDTVNRIEAWAFSQCQNLNHVIVPASVTEVGERAFAYSPSLERLTVSEGLQPELLKTCNGSGRLDPATHLQYLIINDHAMITGHDYWYVGGFGTPPPDPIALEIPGQLDGRIVRSIATGALQTMALSEVTIPADVTAIGDGAFADCVALVSIQVAEANPMFLSVNGVLFNRDLKSLLQFPAGKTGTYDVPASVIQIHGSAFAGGKVSAVSLPSDLIRIEPATFAGCQNLHRVSLPETVTTIGAGAFSGSGLNEVNIPRGITVIAPYTFAYCSSLSHVTIPDGVVEIGEGAFRRTGLRTVLVGRGVRRVGDSAFDNTYTVCGLPPCYGGDLYGDAMDLYFLGDAPEAARPFGWRFAPPGGDYSVPPRIFALASKGGWLAHWGGMPTTAWGGEPVLLEHPDSATCYVGSSVRLGVRAIGVEPLAFEWQQHMRPVPHATNSVVSMDPVTASAAGPWRVVVRNPHGAVTSQVATVTVRVPATNSYEAAAVALGPLAYWPLDETEQVAAMDFVTASSGNFVGAARLGAPGATPNTGRSVNFGRAASVVAPHNPAWDVGTGDFTVAAWINPSAFVQSGIATKGGYDWAKGWLFDFSAVGDGTLRLETSLGVPGGQGTVQTRPRVVTLNEWQHVVVSCRRDPAAGPGLNTTGKGWTKIYRNGVQVAAGDIGPGNLNNPDLPFALGQISNWAAYFPGRMDEVALFGEALSAEQVADLYAAGFGAPLPLRVTRSGEQLTLTWTGGVLQSASTLGNDGQPVGWSDLTTATSPFTFSLTNAASFFRVRMP